MSQKGQLGQLLVLKNGQHYATTCQRFSFNRFNDGDDWLHFETFRSDPPKITGVQSYGNPKRMYVGEQSGTLRAWLVRIDEVKGCSVSLDQPQEGIVRILR